MTMRRFAKAALWGLLSLCAVGPAVGCAGERAPISRVQPNAVPKTFFLGANKESPDDDPKFYARTTIVDVGFGATQQDLFVGNPSGLSIIKWEITEDRLVGRLAYEAIASTDGKGERPTLAGKSSGQVIFAYPITSHFDIRHDYNPTTGEEMNVVVENSTDRPWYEREYVRVDFSKNLIDDAYHFDVLSDLGLNGVKYNGLDYAVTDPYGIDAPTMNVETGYFDVTNKVMATPETIDLSKVDWAQEYGIKAMAACDFDSNMAGGKGPWGNCNPVELTVRQSFRRVDVNDYEPVDQDGVRFSAYGAFTKERKGYDLAYGMTDEKWHRFVERYDIWERNHYYKDPAAMKGEVTCNAKTTTPVGEDPNRDADKDGTADECSAVTQATGVGGSQCDTFTHKCTLPFQLRKQVPVVWYQSVESTNDFFEGTEWAAHDWDVAMRSAGQVAKYAECKATKGANCEQYAVYSGQQEENDDAIGLAREVDDCRKGAAYKDRGKDEGKCTALADEVGQKRGLSAQVIALAKLPEAVVLCHSPVEAGDPAACGDLADPSPLTPGVPGPRKRLPEGMTATECRDLFRSPPTTIVGKAKLETCRNATLVRFGDLRYQQVLNVDGPQSQGPWGIMADATDPLTGRKISSNVTVYTHLNRQSSQLYTDQMRYLAGELSTEEITNGTNVRDFASAARAASFGGFEPMSKTRLVETLSAAQGHTLHGATELPRLSTTEVEKARDTVARLRAVTADTRAPSVNEPIFEARRAHAVAAGLDAKLVNKETMKLAGVPANGYSDSMRGAVSPLQAQNPALARKMEALREEAMEKRGSCQVDGDALAVAPYSVAAMSELMQQKFGKFDRGDDKGTQLARANKIAAHVAQKIHYGVMAHEMGHSVGLRHNFVSSSDAFNYRPQYWQLRTKNGQVSQPCTDLAADGAACVGPRYFDTVTKEESDNLLPLFMHSSVMDYPGDLAQDFLGLGAYDFGAARMIYGDAVGVYKNTETYNTKSRAGKIVLNKLNEFGGLTGWQYAVDTNGARPVHYSQLQKEASLIQDCHSVDPAAFQPARWDSNKDGAWSPLLDGLLVSVDGQTTRCRTQPIDFVQWRSLKKATAQDVARPDSHGPAVDSEGRLRVATGFASDNRADIGNASVFRHDSGADPYEQMSFLISQAEMLHIFSDYRRGRTAFSVRGAATRWRRRYAEKIRDIGKSTALFFSLFPDQRTALVGELRENVIAAGMAFDYFSRELTRPESGGHTMANNVLRVAPSQNTNALLVVPTGATGYFGNVSYGGAPLESMLANDKGDYDVDYTMNAGSYYKKIWTPMLMTESVDKFVSAQRDDFFDARPRAVSLADIFPDGYRRWFGNMLTGDDFIRGQRVAADAGGRPLTEAETKFPAQALGTTSFWRPAPEVCFPKDGTTVCSDLDKTVLGSQVPNTAVLDPQVGWEVQKFLIAWTMQYLPENQKLDWLNQMDILELGKDGDPGFSERVELHDPNGKVYLARSFGKETVFGKSIQKGIGARVLEHANDLLVAAYDTETVTVAGSTFVRAKRDTNGQPILKNGAAPARALSEYMSVISFLRESVVAFGFGDPKERGFH